MSLPGARLPLLIAGLVTLSTACVTSPGNGAIVCETSDSVPFTGVSATPGAEVELHVWNHFAEQWETFATASASTRPRAVGDGAQVYPWAVDVVVPIWKWEGGGNRHAEVRVVEAGGSELAFADATRPWESCFDAELASGAEPEAAWSACESEAPVIQMLAQQVNLDCECQYDCN